uniref:ANK_REP_REGION domain-containing protein n=1 Tax=Macrostomum lignano TaxID=282301 RepID=A0A1I8GVB8_9PLAT
MSEKLQKILAHSKDLISSLQVLIYAEKKADSNVIEEAKAMIEEAKAKAVENLKNYDATDDLTDENGDTPLILAISSGHLDLVETLTQKIEGSLAGLDADSANKQCRRLLSRCNKQRENALLRAAGMCNAKFCQQEQTTECLLERRTEKIFLHLLYFLLVNCSKTHCEDILNHKSENRQNLLHLMCSTEYCEKCQKFCLAETALKRLRDDKIRVDAQLEDFKYNTPLFLLIKSIAQHWTSETAEPDVKAAETILDELRFYCEMFGIKFRSLLKNSYGMDVAHICARLGCIKASDSLYNYLAQYAQRQGCILELYKYKRTTFASQTILGGPIDGPDAPRSSRQRPFPYGLWTALHFACKGGHVDSVAYLLKERFSLLDCTKDGKTCTDLAFERPQSRDAILQAYKQIGSANDGLGPNGMSWVLEYARSVDSVKCALDFCDGDCENHQDALTEREADEELLAAWRLFKKKEETFLNQCDQLKEMTVKAVIALLHSSLLRKELRKPSENRKRNLGELLSDTEIVEFFCDIAEQNIHKGFLRPRKDRWQILKGDLSIVLDPCCSPNREYCDTPLFSYLDNGRIFQCKLGKPTKYFKELSLVAVAISTGRPCMAKALLITRQFDMIPMSLAAIGIKAFASKIALNAIDALIRGSTDSEADLVFTYMLGKMIGVDSTGTSGRLPSSRHLIPKSTTKQNGSKNDSRWRKFSTLELIRKSERESLYGAECIQELVQKIWRQRPQYSSAKKADIFEEKLDYLRSNSSPDSASESDKGCGMNFLKIRHLPEAYPVVLRHDHPSLHITAHSFSCNAIGQLELEFHEWRIRYTTPGEGHRSYFFDAWNIYDQLNIIFLLAAFFVKFFSGRERGTMYDDDATIVGNQSGIYGHFLFKMLMSVALLLASAKFMKTLRYSRPIGTNVVIMPQIFYRDLLPFVIILTILILSFGAVFIATLTVGQYSFEDAFGGKTKHRSLETLFEIYTRPLLTAFGELQLEKLYECEPKDGERTIDGCYYPLGITIFARYLLPVFLLIVNLVMFNMLIAKFSNSVSRFERRSQLIWLAMRHELLLDFCRLNPLPPPFNILGIISNLYFYFSRHFEAKRIKPLVLDVDHQYNSCSACKHCRQNKETQKEAKDHVKCFDINRCSKWNPAKDPKRSCSSCQLCRNVQVSRSLGKDHEDFLIRQANQFRQKRHLIRSQRVETIEDDIEEELLGSAS